MKPAIWLLVKMVYANLLRPLIVKAVESPDTQWDDFLLAALDRLFDYKP